MATSSPLSSLRVRLILLHAAAVTLVVAVFGTAVCYMFWRSLVAQVDADVVQHAQQLAASLKPASDGTFDLNLSADARAYFSQEQADRPYYGLWTPDGRPIDVSDARAVSQQPGFIGTRTNGSLREFVMDGPAGTTLLVGRGLEGVSAEVRALAATVAAAGAGAAILSILIGWVLAGRALAPIARISGTARAMVDGDLAARIPVADTDAELGQLAQALNSAFDRLRDASEQVRRFTADASHELRTPVAALHAETEWALDRVRSDEAYRESLATCRAAALRIGRVVDGLLTLARADAHQLLPVRAPFDVASAVHEVVALARPVAEQRSVQVDAEVDPTTVVGDREQLQQAISNLVMNGVYYNRPGGSVTVRGGRRDEEFVLNVRDTGIGIPAADASHVFERFYRIDGSRGVTDGAGLGLPIARWIVEQHGGSLRLEVSSEAGSEFVMRLPIDRARLQPR